MMRHHPDRTRVRRIVSIGAVPKPEKRRRYAALPDINGLGGAVAGCGGCLAMAVVAALIGQDSGSAKASSARLDYRKHHFSRVAICLQRAVRLGRLSDRHHAINHWAQLTALETRQRERAKRLRERQFLR